jgi:acyl carrier protein
VTPPTRETVFAEVKRAIAFLVGDADAASISEDTKLDDDLMFDDLDFVELFMELEVSFDAVELDESRVTEAKTVKDLVDYLLTAA